MSVVTLSLAKDVLRVDYDDENALIQKYIDSAESYVEKATGYKLTSDTVTEYCNGGDLALRPVDRLPITSITSVYDTEAESTEAASDYHLRDDAIYRDSDTRWDAGPVNRWRTIYVGGYTDATRPVGLEGLILDLVSRAFHAPGARTSAGVAGYRVAWDALMDGDIMQRLDTFRSGGSFFG